MNALLLFAHPNNQNSFSAAIRDVIVQEMNAKGYEARVNDLYANGFQPVLTLDEMAKWGKGEVPEDVLAEQEQIKWADVLFFIYPTWWGSAPAILKGYFDRVLTQGFAYQYTEKGHEKLLHNKKAVIIQPASASQESLEKRNLDASFKAVMGLGILDYCGIETVDHLIFDSIYEVSDEDRQNMLQHVREVITKL